MNLKEKINNDFKEAFRAKDDEKKAVLSMLRSEITNKEIELKKREQGLNDDEVLTVVSRAVKQRKDSVAQYKEGGREELAQKEQKEIEILEAYLPPQMSDEDAEKEIKAVIAEMGATGKADLGKVMGAAMGKLKGQVDGNKVKEIAEKLLQ